MERAEALIGQASFFTGWRAIFLASMGRTDEARELVLALEETASQGMDSVFVVGIHTLCPRHY